jgi:hypothetical protein
MAAAQKGGPEPYALKNGRLVPKSEVLGGEVIAPRRGRPSKIAQMIEAKTDGIDIGDLTPTPQPLVAKDGSDFDTFEVV